MLKEKLTEIQRITDQEWLASLDQRKKQELEFHDLHRDRSQTETLDQDTYERLYGNRKYYEATAPSRAYVDKWVKENAKDKVFLDYACGNGSNAIKAAQAGASLAIGIDISAVSVGNAAKDAVDAAVQDNTFFVQADAENTKLPDNSIDVIICSGMLHHLDLSCAFPELKRILAPGGKILAVEALDYNPAIKLYRKLTPAMRTDWETSHILSLKDLKFAKHFFDIGEVRYWHILSILGPHMRPLFPLLHTIDNFLTKIAGVQLMAWVFTFELTKQR